MSKFYPTSHAIRAIAYFNDDVFRLVMKNKYAICTSPPGSSAEMMILGHNRHHLIIVESEFDAMLIHQEAGDIVTAIALCSVQARPDALSNDILTKAKQILKALDIGTTEKKEKAGYKEWLWWKKQFRQSKRSGGILQEWSQYKGLGDGGD